jgi:hypothetical protein
MERVSSDLPEAMVEVRVGGKLAPVSGALASTLYDTLTKPDYVTQDASHDRLELLQEANAVELGLDAALPGMRRIGLWDPIYSQHEVGHAGSRSGGGSSAVELRPVSVGTAAEIDTAFAAMIDAGVEAVFVLPFDQLNNSPRLAALALEPHLPSMFGFREVAEAGGLLSYGADVNAEFLRLLCRQDQSTD